MNTKISKQKIILLVEDQDVIAQTVSLAMNISGYHCEHASNGIQAITMLEEGLVPDLIILDIMMPVMDGFTLLEELRKKPGMQDIPVIMLTALNDAADVMKALKIGAVDYHTKPIDVEALLRSVERFVEKEKQP